MTVVDNGGVLSHVMRKDGDGGMELHCITSSSLQWRNEPGLHHNFLFGQFMVAPFMHLTPQLATTLHLCPAQVEKDATSRNWFSRRARYGSVLACVYIRSYLLTLNTEQQVNETKINFPHFFPENHSMEVAGFQYVEHELNL